MYFEIHFAFNVSGTSREPADTNEISSCGGTLAQLQIEPSAFAAPFTPLPN
ncbi:MAG TPA: hypothetical protein PKA76_12820 [Pirellulaceae bacterium]|nr:hypothetical protein [Pirellulaceae bacterium]